MAARSIGMKAATAGIALFELTPRTLSLEEAFMDLTRESVEYHGATTVSEVFETPESLETAGSAA
jgi:ABC-2 type transport system ATP-binding protein